MRKTGMFVLAALFLAPLMNVSYFEGLEKDFSNLLISSVTENSTLPVNYSIADMREGEWAIVNLSQACENCTLELAAVLTSANLTELNISFTPPLEANFSNLQLEYSCENGSLGQLSYETLAMNEGAWTQVVVTAPVPEPCMILVLASLAPGNYSVWAPVNETEYSVWYAETHGNESVPPTDSYENVTAFCYIYCTDADLYNPVELYEGQCVYEIIPNAPECSLIQNVKTRFEVIDSQGLPVAASMQFRRHETKEFVKEVRIGFEGEPLGGEVELQTGRYDVSFEFVSPESAIKGILVIGLRVNGTSVGPLKLETIETDGNFSSLGRVEQAYAIDLSGLDFISGTATVTARGNELYKCREWNFTGRSCGGEWARIMNLVPGANYSLALSPEDPGYAERLAINACSKEYATASNGTWNGVCSNTYPGSALFYVDRTTEISSVRRTNPGGGTGYWAGLRINSTNTSVTDCYSIQSASICYAWWSATTNIRTCSVSVDAHNGASYVLVNGTCPGTSGPGAPVCSNVTSLENWTCDNFFGSSHAIAKSEVVHSGAAPSAYYNITWGALYFNVTYVPLVCGFNLTSNVKLRQDFACNGTAFNLAGDNLTFDCDGHGITGNGSGDGILISGRQNVTVKNCAISGFANGVYINGSNSSYVTNSSISNSTNGVRIDFDGGSIPVKTIEIGTTYASESGIGPERVDWIPAEGEFAEFEQVYAIDLSGLNFTNGTAIVTAKGNELYKCFEWDFAGRSCGGEWAKIMDLVPEGNYSLTLTPVDPGYAERLAIRQCNLENVSASSGNFVLSCNYTYPGDALFSIDAKSEVAQVRKQSANTYWAGIRTNSSNSSAGSDCYSIDSVSICYAWWSDTGSLTSCDVSVDANAGAGYTAATTACPGTSAPSSVTCTDVTSLESWSCGNFFGPSYAMAKSEALHSGSGVNGYYNVYWNALYFNVTYDTFGCGIGVDEDVNLTESYSCSGTALSIQADNITFDCKGYTLTGNTTGVGILLSGRNNVTIKNCIISNFSQGIFFNNSNSSFVMNTSISNSASYGIWFSGSRNNNVSASNSTSGTNTGVRFDINASSNYLSSDRICSNSLDISNVGTNNTGAGYCDRFYNWTESSHSGCKYSCSSVWHRFYGNATASVILTKEDASANVYSWTASGFNIYFADYDSSIGWDTLYPIGRNTTNETSTNDFVELDTKFGTSGYSDNITTTYSTGGSPKETWNYTVYDRPVDNVSVANSTLANTTFKTGILWDSGDGGTEYSSALGQSTVWVVRVNQSASDAYGTYDYLAQVPYTLASYEGASNFITIYLEYD